MDRALATLTVLCVAAVASMALVLVADRRRRTSEPTKITRVTVTTDGPIQPEDLQAISHLLAAHCENPDAVFQAILTQIAKDEAAAGLDTALDQIREGGTR